MGMRVVRPTDSPSVPLCSISECLHTRARLSVSLPLSSLVALSSRLSAFLSLHSLSVGWSVTFVCAWTRAVLLKAEGRKGKKKRKRADMHARTHRKLKKTRVSLIPIGGCVRACGCDSSNFPSLSPL